MVVLLEGDAVGMSLTGPSWVCDGEHRFGACFWCIRCGFTKDSPFLVDGIVNAQVVMTSPFRVNGWLY